MKSQPPPTYWRPSAHNHSSWSLTESYNYLLADTPRQSSRRLTAIKGTLLLPPDRPATRLVRGRGRLLG